MIAANIQKLPMISESLNNYPKSESLELVRNAELIIDDLKNDYGMKISYEEQFWKFINGEIKEGRHPWGKNFHFWYAMISEWVPRIPGGFWTEKSAGLRKLANKEIIERTGNFVVYTPIGKSSKVMGGLGTFKCAPQHDYRLVSLSVSGNCSAGIPLLISNEIWDRYQLDEGTTLRDLEVKWVKMEENWSAKFKSSIDLVRGCLVLTNTKNLEVQQDENFKTVAHPYTILEYYKNGIPYYDFMYFTINKVWDKARVSNFLNSYKNDENRNGRYIFEPDPNEVIYGADYLSPSDYLQNGKDDINLIETRIEAILNEDSSGVFDSIYNFLMNEIPNENTLERISKQNVIGIPPIQWRGGTSLLTSVKSFLDLVISQNKMISLYDLLQTDYPETFIQIEP